MDCLQVPDEVCGYFRDLGEYDYRPAHEAAADAEGGSTRTLIDVDILGHIFEQSITDLEKIRNELDRIAEPVSLEEHKSRRKKEGAFYTPSFITRFNVQQALGGVLKDRFERLRQSHAEAAKGTARSVLADPNVYDLDKLNAPQRGALVRFWEAWQDELATIRLLDPACGSGAFLIQSFDQLHAAYEASNDRLLLLLSAASSSAKLAGRKTGKFPLVAGTWWEYQEKNILVTIAQHHDKFVATCTYRNDNNVHVHWRAEGTIFLRMVTSSIPDQKAICMRLQSSPSIFRAMGCGRAERPTSLLPYAGCQCY